MRSDEEDLDPGAVGVWLRTEVVAAHDALKTDPSRAIPAEDIRAELEAKWNDRRGRSEA